ncbi:hypothetical protein EIJ04_19930, partial [Xanthomonas perforans]
VWGGVRAWGGGGGGGGWGDGGGGEGVGWWGGGAPPLRQLHAAPRYREVHRIITATVGSIDGRPRSGFFHHT